MELKLVLESILFSSQKPLTAKELREVMATAAKESEAGEEVRAFKKVKEQAVTDALEELATDHAANERSYALACVAGAWQFVSRQEYAPWVRALVGQKAKPPRLSQPALETLAIIAYRQPLTRAEMEQVRGVSVDGVIGTLVERGLVEQVGRAESAGRPMTYGTTALFLEYFGLASLDDLPAADELRRIPVEKPADLMTTDAGLATTPPSQLTLAQASSSTGSEPVGDESSPDEPGAAEPAPTSSEPTPQP